MKKFIPFILLFLCIFYILPFVFVSSTILLTVTPVLLLITAIIFGGLFGFHILLAVFCVCCALPMLLTSGTIFFVYICVYFVVTMLGNLLGLIFRKKE